MFLSSKDVKQIKESFRRGASSKIDYIKVLKNMRMKLDHDGAVRWVYGNEETMVDQHHYRIKIEQLSPVFA